MSDWDDLSREADHWSQVGRAIDFWWRDDDAVADSPSLRLLLDRPAPIALAVIPGRLEESLAASLAAAGRVTVLQHGIEHRNLAAPGEKKSEFPPGHRTAATIASLNRGEMLLGLSFPGLFRRVLVPPWNRIDPDLTRALAGAGYVGLSTYRARAQVWAAPGLLQINTHVDVIDWRGGRGFVGRQAAIQLIVQHLSARRLGLAEPGEPTGLLTHHLVHDTETWRFIDEFLAWSTSRRDFAWRSASDLFASPSTR
jgi:hypothetical protein